MIAFRGVLMNREASAIWANLEFRKPALLRVVEPMSDGQMLWVPPHGRNCVAWLLWHIAEVEDNWVRDLLYAEPKRYPFGGSVRDAAADPFPSKNELLDYFRDVRGLTQSRLAASSESDFDRSVIDEHFG
jgi:hypothetical protein